MKKLMKPQSAAMVRRLDDLGRIVLPVEMRRTMQLNAFDPVEMLATEDGILLRKFRRGCFFCGGEEGLEEFNGYPVCPKCAEEIAALHEKKEPDHDCA